MKVIIMAAGRGTRISRHINNKPKCIVELENGKPLIKYTIDLLKSKGIDDISIVLGYKGEEIKDVLKDDVKYYENKFFDITNSIVSLWVARENLAGKEDLILMNGDVFLEETLLDDILRNKKSPVLFSDEKRIEEADYKLKYTDGILEKYGKDLDVKETTGEYIGIAKISKNEQLLIKEKLEKMIDNQKHFLWWENVLYEMSEKNKIYVEEVRGKFWAEVDYIEDYLRINEFFKKQ